MDNESIFVLKGWWRTS
ncbi:trp operon leader peptide [Escherichia coli]